MGGDIVDYLWIFGDGSFGSGPTPSYTYSTAGTYNVILIVTDDNGTPDSDSTQAVIGGINQPPDCSQAVPSQEILWPPNHKFKNIRIQGVTDPDGDPVSIIIDSIYQDEPVGRKIDAKGVGTDTAKLRAERTRSKNGNGRVYHINFTAYDDQGGNCSGQVTVGVPPNKGKKTVIVDDGANFDSTTTEPQKASKGKKKAKGKKK